MSLTGSLATTGHPGTLANTTRSKAGTAGTCGTTRTALISIGDTHANLRCIGTNADGTTQCSSWTAWSILTSSGSLATNGQPGTTAKTTQSMNEAAS